MRGAFGRLWGGNGAGAGRRADCAGMGRPAGGEGDPGIARPVSLRARPSFDAPASCSISSRRLRGSEGSLNAILRASAIGAVIFVASLIGMGLQSLIPTDTLNASKGAIGAMTGVIALLLALVLGLLIWTAFAVFTGQQSEAFSLGPLIAEVDLLLEQCGPEAAGGRRGLRASLQRSRDRFFGAEGPRMLTVAEIKTTRSNLSQYFDNTRLADERRQRLFETAGALARKYHETQAAMLIRLQSPFPDRVLDIVVFWAALLFVGDGLLATPNAVTVCAHLAGAFGIATAVFLIVELSHPYSGYIRLKPDGLDRILAALGTVDEAAA